MEKQIDKTAATAWMVRQDGKVFPCSVHYYGNPEDVEETIFAAQWLFDHTCSEKAKQSILELIALYGKSISPHRNSVRNLLIEIKRKPYRFLDEAFVREHGPALLECCSGSVEQRNKEVCNQLNNEFMRARLGGMYDTVEGCRDLYCRISSSGFDWSDRIRQLLCLHRLNANTVTVVRDFESTGAFFYYKVGTLEIHRLPIEHAAQFCAIM